MTKFNSTKNKLKIISDKNDEIFRDAGYRQIQNNYFKYNTVINVPNQFLYNKQIDLSTDWETLESISDTYYYAKHKVWVIEWSEFDIRMLPHLSVEILYRKKGSNIPDNLSQTPYTHKYFQISDIGGQISEYYKKVRMNVSIYVEKYGEEFDYEVKLNVILTNPREYR